MPTGRYAVLGDDGEPVGSESFRCAPGPAGWRYFANVTTNEPVPHDEIVDVVVDAEWRPVRLRVDTGAHQLFLEADRGRVRRAVHAGTGVGATALRSARRSEDRNAGWGVRGDRVAAHRGLERLV